VRRRCAAVGAFAAKLAIAGDVPLACDESGGLRAGRYARRGRYRIAYFNSADQRADLIVGKDWLVATRAEIAALETFPPIARAAGLSCRYEADTVSRIGGYKPKDAGIRDGFYRRLIVRSGGGIIESLDVFTDFLVNVIIKSATA
jgi:hypothetical protein